MLSTEELAHLLEREGLETWRQPIQRAIEARLSDAAHGDFAKWQAALARLPQGARAAADLTGSVIAIDAGFTDSELAESKTALKALSPWRKGPFRIGPIYIDAEWRSDLKWDRVAAGIGSLEDQLVLDVGCGNGYYALRMRGAGARAVVGIDPTVLYAMQFQAITRFVSPQPVVVLPLRLEELPRGCRAFDTAFSMGVLYHQRSPVEHLRDLRAALKPRGTLLLETLVLPGAEPFSRTPNDRYARMRNVWHLPTVPELKVWLERTGFVDIVVLDETVTTPTEQRSTEWMPFESLSEALDPSDTSRTIEGWPAPRRAVLRCILA